MVRAREGMPGGGAHPLGPAVHSQLSSALRSPHRIGCHHHNHRAPRMRSTALSPPSILSIPSGPAKSPAARLNGESEGTSASPRCPPSVHVLMRDGPPSAFMYSTTRNRVNCHPEAAGCRSCQAREQTHALRSSFRACSVHSGVCVWALGSCGQGVAFSSCVSL
jgi:hypothetical protein